MIKLEESPYPSVRFHALMPQATAPAGHESFSLAEGNRTLITSARAEAENVLRFESNAPGEQVADRRGKFSDAERDNILCLLASPDGRFGSLKLNAKAQIYTCRLGDGHQIYYRMKPGQDVWLRPVRGEIDLDGANLCVGHSAAVSDQKDLTITALSESEFLLIVLW